MNNERFPHTVKIKRVVADEYGTPILDFDNKASYEIVTLEKAVMFDGEVVRDEDGTIQTESVTEIECGYRTSSRSVNSNGDVVVAQTELHSPLFLTELFYGDTAEITDNDRTYTATVIGKRNSNWGSKISINEVNN